MKSHLSRALALALGLVALQAPAQPLVNGSFADGLAGWQVLGDASVQGSGDAARLWLSNASLLYADDAPLAAGALNRSGTAAADVGVPGGVEQFTGLSIGALDPDAANGLVAYEGSEVRQSFTAAAGDTLSFRWSFATRDGFADYAFVVLDGQAITLAATADATLPGTDGYLRQTGEHLYSVSLSGGTHTLGFGVVDVGDYDLSSALSIGAVQVSPVPEAPALALMLAGLIVVGASRRR